MRTLKVSWKNANPRFIYFLAQFMIANYEDVEDIIGGKQEYWFGKKDAMNQARWRVGVGRIAARVG